MRAAPDMFPTLDDALHALDDFPGRPVDVATAARFLRELDEVRDAPALVLDQVQAEHMAGAYHAGVRCADTSGHVLVMSLPVFLELCPPPVPARQDQVLDWLFANPLATVALALWSCAALALLADHDATAGAWLFGLGAVAALCWGVGQLPPTSCSYSCNSGRACSCARQPNMKESK